MEGPLLELPGLVATIMRAREFITEAADAPMRPGHRSATRGLHLYKDGEHRSTDYVLNRVMMAAACTDGTFVPDIDQKSWIGKNKSAHPYTRQEADMLKMAYRAAGASYSDANHGDMDSEEAEGGNTKSPVVSFRGYPR